MTDTSTEAVRGLAKELRRIAGVHEDAHRRHGAKIDRQAADMLEAMLRERESEPPRFEIEIDPSDPPDAIRLTRPNGRVERYTIVDQEVLAEGTQRQSDDAH